MTRMIMKNKLMKRTYMKLKCYKLETLVKKLIILTQLLQGQSQAVTKGCKKIKITSLPQLRRAIKKINF